MSFKCCEHILRMCFVHALHLTLQTRGQSRTRRWARDLSHTTHFPFSLTVAGIEPVRPTAMLSKEKQGFTTHSTSQQSHVKKTAEESGRLLDCTAIFIAGPSFYCGYQKQWKSLSGIRRCDAFILNQWRTLFINWSNVYLSCGAGIFKLCICSGGILFHVPANICMDIARLWEMQMFKYGLM